MGAVAHEHGKVHTAAIAPQSTSEAIEMVRKLEKMPVDAVMIFPPLLFAWGKVGGDIKVRFYEDLVNATAMPITLFQFPVANYWYDPDTVCRIAAAQTHRFVQGGVFQRRPVCRNLRKLKASNAQMRILTGNDASSARATSSALSVH